MKTILFLTRKLQPAPGGMQTQTRALLASLGQQPNIRIKIVGYSGGVAGLPFFLVRALVAAVFARVDTVHVGDALLTILFPILAAVRPQIRRTVTVHGLDVSWSPLWYRALIRSALHFADVIVAVSRSTESILRGFNIPAERIQVIPCAMAPEVTSSAPRMRQILLLGRMIKRKGVVWFVQEVVPGLLKYDPSLSIIIAGDGPERALLQNCGYPQVSLLGTISEERKRHFLLESTLLVVPNIEVPDDPEGFGLVCLEATAHGLPVVAARLQGLQDAVAEGVTGLFFRPGSADDALRVIKEALSRVWPVAPMHQALRQSYDPQTIASRYVHDVF